jgi:Sulfotransferase family
MRGRRRWNAGAMATSVGAAPRFARHVLERTVVLPRHRVLFLPMPKAACTNVLWTLAGLAGLPEERFDESPLPEVSPALTVHDMNAWPDEHRLIRYDEPERERLLAEDGWLRFTLVRDPAPRLWSGWQSKLLLREPRFVDDFGDAPWFPRVPWAPREILDDFRAFVAALGGGEGEDVHWSVQHDLAGQLPLTHVGRVERLEETLALLAAHAGADLRSGRHENRSPLPLPPGLYDEQSAAILRKRHRADYAAYGYAPPVAGGDLAAWEAEVEPLLPLLRTSIDEHARLGQLHRVAQRRRGRVQSAEERLETVSTRQAGGARSPAITNREGVTDFNVRWAWAEAPPSRGMTAVVRIRDEAVNLPWVLPPLLAAVERVALLDNGSSDGSAEVARRVAREHAAEERLEVHAYPFAVSRCGEEHLATPPDSVHSLTYFYNWSFAHVRTAYSLKWDGDMVLSDAAVRALRDLSWQLEATELVVKVPRHPLYVVDERRAFVDTLLRNCEPWGWPNGPGYSFAKAIDWELPLWEAGTPALTLPDWGCVELKWLGADEFGHWSHTDFEASARTSRKRREWEVFRTLADGGAPPEGVVAVHAPAGVHVIEHVRESWLPRRAAGR